MNDEDSNTVDILPVIESPLTIDDTTPDQVPARVRATLSGVELIQYDDDDYDELWMLDLDRSGKENAIRGTTHNLTKIIINARNTKNAFVHNAFTNSEFMNRTFDSGIPDFPVVISSAEHPRELDEGLISALCAWLTAPENQGGYGLSFDLRVLKMALKIAADRQTINPLQDMLDATEWDGIDRLKTFFHDYLGCENNLYHTECAINWFVAGVARAFEPGHKFDFTPVVEGSREGGQRKSTFVENIARGLFGTLGSDDIANDNVFVQKMQGCHVVELAEMEISSKRDTKKLKSRLSQTADKTRVAYSVAPRTYYRQFITMGTADSRDYLIDPFNNRRFWPLVMNLPRRGEIDTDRLIENIDNIWAQAVAIYNRRRAEQPHGTLDLSLSRPSREYAESLYEGRRVTDDADDLRFAIEDHIMSTVQPGHRAGTEFWNFKQDGRQFSVETSFVLKPLWCAATNSDPHDYVKGIANLAKAAAERTNFINQSGAQGRRGGVKGVIYEIDVENEKFIKLLDEHIRKITN
ncbi:virulence-associated E family protein [Loktanella salsilacus]|uniref:virulence-associated E family protein n=1 Tax=Loktanella salsilacus TaxID=195913 RepID=UPI001113D6DC|nr:virulence-associated E family protein [Loktanella salsilacus]